MRDRRVRPGHRVVGVADQEKVDFAREQRRKATQSERLLWDRVRTWRAGRKFRRQHPIGDFVRDFYCANARLAVEIDGPTHDERPGYDAWRDEQLAHQGVRVLRVRDEQVREDIEGVLDLIRTALTSPPAHLALDEG